MGTGGSVVQSTTAEAPRFPSRASPGRVRVHRHRTGTGVITVMSGGGRRPVSRMYRHEPQSLALRAAAGVNTGVTCLKHSGEDSRFAVNEDSDGERQLPEAPAGERPKARDSGRKHFVPSASAGCSRRQTHALVTNVGVALDHGEDYTAQVHADRSQPPSRRPVAPLPTQALSPPSPVSSPVRIAQPPATAARQAPPFAVDSSYGARPRASNRPPASTAQQAPLPLEDARRQREAGVSSRDRAEAQQRHMF